MKVINEHNCKAIEKQSAITISKRFFNFKERWFWEEETKEGIKAHEIKFCPYCGEELK